MFSGKRVYVNEDGTIYSVEDESTKENLQPEKNKVLPMILSAVISAEKFVTQKSWKYYAIH